MRTFLLFGIFLMLGCQEPTKIELDNKNDPNTTSYIPAAPTAVDAELVNSSIIIEWVDNSEAETGFRIERSIDGEDFTSLSTVQPNVTIYEDEPDSLAFNSVLYRVFAFAEAGDSESSLSNPINGRYPVLVNIDGGGIVNNNESSFSATVPFDSTLQLTATPLSGWEFSHWLFESEKLVINPLDVRVIGRLEYQALFKRLYDFEALVNGNGRVRETLVLSKNTYSDGSLVTLEAMPDSGWEFVNWSGDLSGNTNPTDIRIDQAKSVTANFSQSTYKLDINVEGGGSVTENLISGGTIDEGYTFKSIIDIIAIPSEGWQFSHWEGDLIGIESQKTIQLSENRAVTAVFIEKEIDLEVLIQGSGEVIQQVITAKTSTYRSGTNIELTANPSAGWQFIGWSGDHTGTDNPDIIILDQAQTITATFEPKPVTINTTQTGQGSISVILANGIEEGGSYQAGSELTLEAIPADSSWYFERWEGDLTSSNNPATFIIEDHSDIQAVFRNEVTDIDGNIYPVVRIGNQTWMAENLKVTKFNEGTEIQFAENGSAWNDGNSYAYPDLRFELVEIHGLKYGNEIPVNQSKNVCPEKWIVPTVDDFRTLLENSNNNASRLMENNSNYWNGSNYEDDLGFNAKGSGYISNNLTANDFQESQYYSTRNQRNKTYAIYSNKGVAIPNYSSGSSPDIGASIRCIKAN